MNHVENETFGIYKTGAAKGPGPERMGVNTLGGNDVYNHLNEDG